MHFDGQNWTESTVSAGLAGCLASPQAPFYTPSFGVTFSNWPLLINFTSPPSGPLDWVANPYAAPGGHIIYTGINLHVWYTLPDSGGVYPDTLTINGTFDATLFLSAYDMGEPPAFGPYYWTDSRNGSGTVTLTARRQTLNGLYATYTVTSADFTFLAPEPGGMALCGAGLIATICLRRWLTSAA